MKHWSLFLVAVALLAGLGWGCGEEIIGDERVPPPLYLSQTSPENVVKNLATAYVRRETAQYAVLLDPAFIFKFQEGDIPAGLERDYWNRDEDSTGTGGLFGTTEVVRIGVDPGAFVVEDSIRAEDPGVKRIRLTRITLEVEQFNGTTFVVQGDIQDMYFRRGNAAAGTDSTKWYLLEWRDTPGGGLKPAGRTLDRAADRAAPATALVVSVSWGLIKQAFR